MARMYRSRGPRRNRNRIYTVISLIIIVGIIAYMYIPRGAESESNSEGLITNSNHTTTDYPGTEGNVKPSQESVTRDTNLQSFTPDWATTPGSDTSSSTTETYATGIPEKINEVNNALNSASGMGGISTTIQTPIQSGNSEADKLIEQAKELLKQGMMQTVPARDKFNQALRSRTINAQQRQYVKSQLSSLAQDWLFNKSVALDDSLCSYYTVKSGDMLQIIGEKNKVPYEILMAINGISDAKTIRVGQKLKIANGPFNAKVYRSSFTMDIYLQNTYITTYKVGLGLPGSETPTGLWKVKPGGKLIEPVWTDPRGKTYYPSDPDYPLGSRWIALEGVSGEAVGKQGFAIHGTHEPETLGTASSQGCIRLENSKAILVYNMLFPGCSTVEVLN